MAIRDLSSLRRHLQWAIELEHATIPPYLVALYSIKEGCNQEAAEILRSIVMEEMLHMTLAANVLNAVGGSPRLDAPHFIPDYPAYLPHSDHAFLVPLAGFSKATIGTLMQIERPEAANASAEDDHYETIAQFYAAVVEGLQRLSAEIGNDQLFCGDPRRQVCSDETVYDGSGRIIAVTGLESSLEALSEIMHQGEGLDYGTIWDGDHNMFHPTRNEVGHYFRLHEILEGRRYQRGDTAQSGPSGEPFEVDWNGVYKPANNPRIADHPADSEAAARMRHFCREYCGILRLLERGFNGDPHFVRRSVGAMYELRQAALELMRLPGGDGDAAAGISFEYQPAEAANPADDTFCIRILADGPYAVQGAVPLLRKSIARSRGGESLAWRKHDRIDTLPDYALCRCGASAIKPFCDGSHATIGFDGAETAPTGPSAGRQKSYPGEGMMMADERPLCIHAGFCSNRATDAWKLCGETADVQKRTELIAMIEHCPSGALTYRLEISGAGNDTSGDDAYESLEPHLAQSIGVIPNGPLWVTGGIPVLRADGVPFEVRNRVTLCRCGHSKNKPFCDGTHAEIGFKG
jgi:CDGSH-type Zn-finger protein